MNKKHLGRLLVLLLLTTNIYSEGTIGGEVITSPIFWLNLITGGVIAFESLALFIGTKAAGVTQWRNSVNFFFTLLDILGGGVIALYLLNLFNSDAILIISYVLLFLSHVIRTFQYLLKYEKRFCFNFPLFVFNNIRLLLLILSAIFTFRSFYV